MFGIIPHHTIFSTISLTSSTPDTPGTSLPQKLIRVQYECKDLPESLQATSEIQKLPLHALKILHANYPNNIWQTITGLITGHIQAQTNNVAAGIVEQGCDAKSDLHNPNKVMYVDGKMSTHESISERIGTLTIRDRNDCFLKTDFPAVEYTIKLAPIDMGITASIQTHMMPVSQNTLFFQSYLVRDNGDYRKIVTNKRAARNLQKNSSHRDIRTMCREMHMKAMQHKMYTSVIEQNKKQLFSSTSFEPEGGFLLIKTPLTQDHSIQFISLCRRT